MNGDRPPRVAFTTLGCKVNQSETDGYERDFRSAGYECVPFGDSADVYVVNTCTVTHVADRKSRQLLNQAKRSNPDALVVATGCYASIAGSSLADDKTLVVRPRDKDRLLALVEGRLSRESEPLRYFGEASKYEDETPVRARARSMVKVQDGCDSHCTYCIIPRARGRSRSVPVQTVIERVRRLHREGHDEVVITGVDLGSYGENSDGALPDLSGLLRVLLDATEVPRIRVSSLEPGDFRSEWLELWSDSRLCPHLHIPLQSGSRGVLERMERTYTPEEYEHMLSTCRAAIPDLTVTTDVIVGFPGESDAEFDESLAFVRSMHFDGLHVFRYSQRSGTRAARIAGQVQEDIKAARSEMLRNESAACVDRLFDRHVGSTHGIVWEGEREGVWRGLTDTNVRAYAGADVALSGHLSHGRLSGRFRDGMWAESIASESPRAPIQLAGHAIRTVEAAQTQG